MGILAVDRLRRIVCVLGMVSRVGRRRVTFWVLGVVSSLGLVSRVLGVSRLSSSL